MMYTCEYNRFLHGQTYTLTISALYCGTRRGSEASATVNLQPFLLIQIQQSIYIIAGAIGQGILTIV